MTVMAGALVALFLGAAVADAAEIRVRCEKRSGRSKIDVDGRKVPRGTYTCVVTSGSNGAEDTKAAVRGEVEFDFDSNTNEVGDVVIAPDFIQNGSVCAEITGNGITLSRCVACTVR
jgi:hypothetical protein